MDKKINVYSIEVGSKGVIKEIDNTLESMQKMVGGYIEIISLDQSGELDLIVNEEGKLDGLPFNRAWEIDNEVVDIIVGNCFIARHDSDGNSTSIREEDISVIEEVLKRAVAYADGVFVLEDKDGKINIRPVQK